MKKVFSLLLLFFLCLFVYGCKQESKRINFVAEGCEKINSVDLKDLSEFKLPESPQKEGYRFVGWYLDKDFSKEFKDLGSIEEDEITLYAKFEKLEEKFTVTFIDDDKVVDTIIVTKNDKVEYKTLSKENHMFLGWYDGETKFEYGSFVNKDITLKAKWLKNDVNVSINENKHILDKEYALKNEKDGVITIDNNIKEISYTDLKKIYFNGTEEDFRKISIYTMPNKDLEFYINNELIDFDLVDEGNNDVTDKVTIKVVSFLDNKKLEDFSVNVKKNSKLCGEFVVEILANNKVFNEYNDLGECFVKLYEDETKEKEFDKNYFNNANIDKVIYAYFETSKDFINSISGKYKTLNDDECEINGYDITIFGKTFTLEANSLGVGDKAYAVSYKYSDDIITIEVFLGNYFLDGIICISGLYDFNTKRFIDNYYLVR